MSGLRRTRPGDLVPPVVIAGVIVYVLLRTSYSTFPPMHYVVPLPLAVLAVAEFVARYVAFPDAHYFGSVPANG